MRTLLIILLLAAAADAKEPKDFLAAYDAGQDSFNLGKYDDANAHFAHARDLAPEKPGPWRWLGRVARVQKRWTDCLAASLTALRLAPDSPLAAEVRGDVDACRDGLGRPAYPGKLAAGQGAVFVVAADGVRVAADGLAKGVTPLAPFPLTVGRHVLRFESPAVAELTIDVLPQTTIDATPTR